MVATTISMIRNFCSYYWINLVNVNGEKNFIVMWLLSPNDGKILFLLSDKPREKARKEKKSLIKRIYINLSPLFSTSSCSVGSGI